MEPIQFTTNTRNVKMHQSDKLQLYACDVLEEPVEFTICVCHNLYGLTKAEICINTLLSSLLDRQEQEKLQTG